MELTRKEMLKLGLLGSAALAFPLERAARTDGRDPLKQLPRPFRAELPIPETLKPDPARSTPARDFYEVTARRAEADILPGKKTPVWTYDGFFIGPVISARSGRPVVVRHINRLNVPTSVHLHGGYVDGDSDGHPDDLIQPGQHKDYFYSNEQTARTMWFHDHTVHVTALNVYRGLAGGYLLEDDFEDNLPLPQGDFQVPLVIQDKLFNQDGTLDYPFGPDDHSSNGLEGNVLLVNGKPWPRMEVSARKYRFRVLNASNARQYQLSLSTGRPMFLVGTEGGLIEKAVPLRSFHTAPAERHVVVVDFSEYPVGTQVILRNTLGDKEMSRVMRFDVVRKAKDDSTIPPVIRPLREQIDPTHQPTDLSEVVRTRRWVFKRQHGFWSINGKIWNENRIDAAPREGETEIWEFINNGGGWIHPIHVHLINFKILSRNGRPPNADERGWKDTVFLGPNDTARVLMKWPKVPIGPNPGEFVRRYPMHCHVIEHEDHDMMAQFEVRA